MRHHRYAIKNCKLDDVGQVVLVLRVFVAKACQPFAQQGGGHRHDAAVNFMNLALNITGVFVLNNGANLG